MKLRLNLLLFTVITLRVALYAQEYRTIAVEKMYVATDRYYFEPGEKVEFSIFIGGDNNIQKQSRKVKVTLENIRGQILDSVVLATLDTKLGGSISLPTNGGIYYLKAIGIHQLNYLVSKPMVKEVFVQEYLTKNFFINLQLDKNNYTPLSSVNANISYTTSGNKAIADMEVEVHLTNNGDVIAKQILRTSENGTINTSFTLPEFARTDVTNFYITTSCLYRGETFTQSKKIKTDKQKIFAQVFYEHGNTGYIIGQENTVVAKTVDEFGNDYDIVGSLIDEKGKVILHFESFAQGLGNFSFTPEPNKKYYFVSDDISISLEEAPYTRWFSSFQTENKFGITVSGQDNNNYRWIITEKSNILLDKTGKLDEFIFSISEPTILASTLLVGDKIVAQRHYLLGIDKINYATIKTPDSIMMAKDFVELSVSHPTNKAADFSLAIVEENNMKQIEDKSHNALTWLLLGSEYAREIERPQFYFDKTNPKATKALSLLMNTLHTASIRDLYTGLAKAYTDKAYLNNYVIGGVLWENTANYNRLTLKNAAVNIKNSNIGTTTDEFGVFRLEIPSSFNGALELVIKKGKEKQTFSINNLSQYKDFSQGFTAPRSIVQGIDLFKPLIQLADINNSTLAKTASNISISAGKPLIEKDKNVNNFTSYDIASMPARSLKSMSAVYAVRSVYYWNFGSISPLFPGDLYLTPYQEPFYLELEQITMSQKNIPSAIANKRSTLYWSPSLHLDASALNTVSTPFYPKSGGYRILAEGMDEDGNFFYGEKYIQIKEKLDVVTNIPTQLFIGDIPKIPVSVTNNLNRDVEVNISITGKESQMEAVKLNPYETIQKFYALDKLLEIGEFKAYISVTSSDFEYYQSDIVKVKAYHIQEEVNIGGDISATKKVNLSNLEEGSFFAKLKIYPTFDEQMLKISENMLRQPGGCFEQVSSSNYPNIMVLMLLKSSNSKKMEVINRATDYLNTGYQLLANYETPSGGFEWYGHNPPHASLTAYGLLQFHLIKEIGFNIDAAKFDRNLDWLWKQRDKRGGFDFHPGKYGFASAPYEVSNAYITWVLSRVSSLNLNEQVAAIENDLKPKFDAYKMALFVNTLFNLQRNSEAEKYLEILKKHLIERNFSGLQAEKSVVNAYGAALDAEVIALTLLAALNTQDNTFKQQLKSAIFTKVNAQGYFGSTQATALSLEALTRLGLKDQAVLNHTYSIKLNGNIIDQMEYEESSSYSFDILNIDQIKRGINEFSVETNGVSVPYVLELKWIDSRTSSLHPDLNFSVLFKKDSLEVGENNLVKIRVENTTTRAKGQIVASVNIPATYQISTEELRDLSRKKIVDYYEIKDNILNLYFLEMGPKEVKEIALNLRAAYPGTYHTATHQVFEYYNPEIISKVVSPVSFITEKHQ